MSRSKLRATLAALLISCCALLAPVGANAAIVVNGDFEMGNLSGWTQTRATENGEWYVYNTADEEIFPPPQGVWAAGAFQGGPDTNILYQDVALEPGWSHSLQMFVYYSSFEPIVIPVPNTLSQEVDNQQMRVDVLRAGAPVDSVAAGDVLTTVFATQPAASLSLAPTVVSANLTPFAGQTVRLRAAIAITEGPFFGGIDGVSITSTPPPPPPPPPSNVFSKGKLQLNLTNGTAKLAINVPGTGSLNLVNATKGTKKAPKLIKAANKTAAAAGKVWLPIKPTGAAKTKLKETGKVSFEVKVTFTPTGGTAATKTFSGKLKLGG